VAVRWVERLKPGALRREVEIRGVDPQILADDDVMVCGEVSRRVEFGRLSATLNALDRCTRAQ
jgi:hypothetical protein